MSKLTLYATILNKLQNYSSVIRDTLNVFDIIADLQKIIFEYAILQFNVDLAIQEDLITMRTIMGRESYLTQSPKTCSMDDLSDATFVSKKFNDMIYRESEDSIDEATLHRRQDSIDAIDETVAYYRKFGTDALLSSQSVTVIDSKNLDYSFTHHSNKKCGYTMYEYLRLIENANRIWGNNKEHIVGFICIGCLDDIAIITPKYREGFREKTFK